nr:hypothetical protein BaRGS_017327 [Batillaria attramentaria]
MERKPGETLQELAARIRQDAATCDFPSIQDPQDEALRQRFICSVNNEAVLKALFKVKDTELDFAKAVKIAIETEDAAKVAKETVYDLFKEELGCLKDFELEIQFKSDAKPVFHKARPVPFALRDDLTKGYLEGIAKGVWKPVQFNDYGTPVVPILQFYGKFIPNLATMAEPLYRLTKKASPWKWGKEEQAAFEQLKNVLSSDQVLVHFDPDKPVGLACDASNVGIGAVLFHRYPDGSERPIASVPKTLAAAERNYSQIHKEALATIYGLRKFYQYLYGRQFILVTDHKPLTALFGPKKGTPLLAANRLARWALWLNQFDYTIEYRKTADHGNADALSRLPSGDDIDFDREESGEDTDMASLE